MDYQDITNNSDITPELLAQIREEAFQEQAQWLEWVESQMKELYQDYARGIK